MPGFVDRIFTVGPHAGAHRVAARATVSILLPLVVLLAVDRVEWSIYAAFGAFTSLYGRERVDRPRVLLQATIAALLATLVTLGAVVGMSPQRAWISVPVAVLVAGGAAYLSLRQQWHPPGSLFCVFAFAAVASVPATTADVVAALGVSAASGVLALVVGNAGAGWRRVRRTAPLEALAAPIGGVREGALRYALQASVGVAIAGAMATGAGIGHPYWAMVSAVVPLAARDLGAQVLRGIHRLLGTAAGLLLAWALLAMDPGPLGLVLIIAIMQAGAELLVGRNYALALVCVTPLALTMVHAVAPVPTGELIADRGIETLIGVVVGMTVGYVGRPASGRPAS